MTDASPASDALPEQLAAYRQGFVAVKREARALTDGVSDDRMLARPGPDAWSAVECFEHLNTAGWLLLERMERAMMNAHENGPHGTPPFDYGFISRLFVRSMKPDSFLSLSAPSVYEPAPPATLHPHEVVVEFLALQDDLAGCIAQAHGLDLRRIRLASPAVPLLRISLGAWFEATQAHERRHLAQARRALATVQTRPSGG
jgi:hypothetical protein